MDWEQWGPAQKLSRPRRQPKEVPGTRNLVIEDTTTGFTGAVVRIEKSGGMQVVVLENRHGRLRSFPLGLGFLLDGEPIKLVLPVRVVSSRPNVTASGSRQVARSRARVAKDSRIWVEGIHDAELVEKIWGDDLRVEGIVVEPLHGIDELAAAVQQFQPGRTRRLAVLLDHLVPGSKEQKIADQTMAEPGATNNVLIVGHPYVDIWQAIKPRVIGRQTWPDIPMGEDWKMGMLKRLGLPHQTKQDVGLGWKSLLAKVNNYGDLEPELLGRVEHMIDFVTVSE